jgi:hypothetical protein
MHYQTLNTTDRLNMITPFVSLVSAGLFATPPVPLAQIQMEDGHLPLIEVTIPDGPTGPMAFDTGAENSFIASRIRTSSAVEVTGTTQMGAGSDRDMVEVETVMVSNLQAGDYQLNDVGMILFDMPSFGSHQSTQETSLGVLSPNEFADNVLRIDFGNRLVKVYADSYPVPGTAQSYAASDWNLPEYDVTIGDVQFSAVLDSGNPFPILLPYHWMDRFELIGEPEIITQVQLVDGIANVWRANLNVPVILGEFTLPGIPLFFVEGQQQANIGAGILSSFVVGMDIPQQRVWLEPSSSPHAQPTPSHSN